MIATLSLLAWAATASAGSKWVLRSHFTSTNPAAPIEGVWEVVVVTYTDSDAEKEICESNARGLSTTWTDRAG